MAVVFKGFQSQIADKEGQRLFYPRVMLTGNVGTDLIAAEIAELSSLTKGDTKNVIDNLIIVATRHLQASESVTLDGFGTFRPTLRSRGKGVRTLDEVSAMQSQLCVCFTPCSTRKSDGTVATRSLVTGAKFTRYDKPVAGTTEPGTEEPGGGMG